jgi:succinate-semialdehyde dehydrogenase / glutarate-semialdehyde dehydrogenase
LTFCYSGFDEGEYQNLFADNDQCAQIIADKRVHGVKFTGSTAGGIAVATECGKSVKKGSFELGGNDPFIVLKDADLDRAADIAYKSRMGANAQACINAKRFIIESSVYEAFRDKLIAVIDKNTVIGDPMDPQTTLGPLALHRQMIKLKSQVHTAVTEHGAKIVYG